MGPELPAMVYKPGSMFEWDGERFDYLVVTDEEGLADALAGGWSVGKPDPLDHDGNGRKGGSRPKRKATT